MSPKELLYVEDVLGHQTQMKQSCADFANQLQDMQLQNFVQELSRKHDQCFQQFFNLLNQ